MLKEDFSVHLVLNKENKEWLMYKHYAKAIPSIQFTFGLHKQQVLQGVCCYGSPANNHNNNLGDYKVLELVRLVINEGLPKNILSYFVSQTFKLLTTPLVLLSYADEGKNHCGYIYQATNWIYTGKGGGVDFYRDLNNRNIHSRVMSDWRKKYPEKNRDEIAKDLKWTKIKGTYKHRYFYFLGNKKEKKEMKKLLLEKYQIMDYPKGDNKRYCADYNPSVNLKLF